ncbi:hypothetical protein DMA11_22360 [Marinilabiliaceae bacterium JC017]|nr:hypothetical protein DMA11_22360 [Marinilabiliaceae bacterium JC017]
MELISLPRLRVKELQTVGEKSLSICAGIIEVEPAARKVETILEVYKKGVRKDQASAGEKKGLDKIRDRFVSGFTADLNAEMYFPHVDPVTVEALNRLQDLTQKYGTKITRLPYSEETAAVDNLLADLKEIDTQALDFKVARWVPLIEKANNDFKAADDAYIDEKVRADQTDAATSQAPELIEALENLYKLLFAHVQITGTEPILTAYAKLETLVKSYN